MTLKGTARDLEVIIRENKGKGPTMQVIIHGKAGSEKEEGEAIRVCRNNNVSFLRAADPDIIKSVCYRVYGRRVAVIDNQIKSILNANK